MPTVLGIHHQNRLSTTSFHFVISRATVLFQGLHFHSLFFIHETSIPNGICIHSLLANLGGFHPPPLTTIREALAGCRLQIYRRALYVNGKESPGIFVEGSNASLDPSATAPRNKLWISDWWWWIVVSFFLVSWKDSLVLETAMSRNSNYMGLTEVCCSPSMRRWWCRFDGEVPLNPRRGDDVWPVLLFLWCNQGPANKPPSKVLYV